MLKLLFQIYNGFRLKQSYSCSNLKTIQCYWYEFFAASVPLANSTQEKFIPVAR